MTTPLAERLGAAFGWSLRRTVAQHPPRQPPKPDHEPLPGIELRTPAGPCLLYEQRFPLDYRHGGVALGACLDLPRRALALLARGARPESADLRQAVFLDTETTGLAGGTGTAAFLVGLGFFSEDHSESGLGERESGREAELLSPTRPLSPCPALQFVVRQYFMRDFGEERAMLLALAEALAPFRHVVTFNGKSFDLPLLETRFILARQRQTWQPELHFDLLHPARRLWREQLGSCNLGALEESVLFHRREADVPSWLIPSLYADYLRRGEAGPLRRVFGHNRDDLLSLAALATHLGRRLAEPLESDLGAAELLAVARTYEERGLRAEACAVLEAAHRAVQAPGLAPTRATSMDLGAQGLAPLPDRIRLALALAYRRSGQRERALALWRDLSRGSMALTGLIEQAKHFEHQRRDFAAALDLVEQALAILELRELHNAHRRWQDERANLEQRLARLARKLGS
jgi:hypothetical protein